MPRCSIQRMMKYTEPLLVSRDVRIMATGPWICPVPVGRAAYLRRTYLADNLWLLIYSTALGCLGPPHHISRFD